MALSSVCPTEDAVGTFLEYLVDPLIPTKSSASDSPSLSQQQSVAKQMHGVVILYNYYHRKQHRQLEFLGFESFCKLILGFNPPLLEYMKFMRKSDDAELIDPDKQLSLVEKTIMDACDLCMRLNASKDSPDIEGWAISEVIVFLVDSRKENCLLKFSSVTEGVWSLIEKDVDISNQSPEGMPELKRYKKKRITKKPWRDDSGVNEDAMQQLAFSSVREAADISQACLSILESHTVYSLGKEKSASRFYIMQCAQPTSKDAIQVPIKYAIDSLQGPLIRKVSHKWTITPVVEYFHVLPYAGILSNWFSRDASPNHLESLKVDSVTVQVNMEEDEVSVLTEEKYNNIHSSEPNTSFMKRKLNDLHDVTSEDMMVENKCQSSIPECRSNKSTAGNNVNNITLLDKEPILSSDCALVTCQSTSEDLEKIYSVLASKEDTLSQTALRVLLKKRAKLSLQQRNIEDEIAKCDKCIHTIMNGGAAALALKIDSIVDGCNFLCLKTSAHERTNAHLEGQPLPHYTDVKLTDVIYRKSPCQELDDMCDENTWILPTYHICVTDGGYVAKVTVKGTGFECSTDGDPHSTPEEARESAAANTLVILKSTASKG
ncbi:uncharacterized protein LOC115745196 isoform X1 [Rhodamnia argentea]|uniref:Uncharacterized protein LOC115745196 isoform X1 n=2 Tax=Rhodamnia argentea TaxID=178133 RepID=A0A8B8PNZ8_9MYRT|nr:uncharacterized protein LOC115745196 isoform X1 [Rhodamnia argentea]XP_048140231.1 uncharacterized protein LOC115745196 isoform X1 [Rhodamnia argentea]